MAACSVSKGGAGRNAQRRRAASGGAARSCRLIFWISAWYTCSLVTLFLNKIILSSDPGPDMGAGAGAGAGLAGGEQAVGAPGSSDGRLHANRRPGAPVHLLGLIQMCSTALLGAVKVYGPRLLSSSSSPQGSAGGSAAAVEGENAGASLVCGQTRQFWRDMTLVGVMRGLTVVLGLVSLSHVAVSFVETVKASAPLFTVVFAWLMLGERTSGPVVCSLFPVMIGLVMSSATELSFDTIGFLAAISNNLLDCVQNVFSKRLLNGGLTPVQLQFYTSAAAAMLQIPTMIYLGREEMLHHHKISRHTFTLMLIDGVSFHFQSVAAYCCMSLISPVSQSVANTFKRSMLIFLSIIYFGNEVTIYSGAGMVTVLLGVAAYNWARQAFPAPPSPPGTGGVGTPKMAGSGGSVRPSSQESARTLESQLRGILGALKPKKSKASPVMSASPVPSSGMSELENHSLWLAGPVPSMRAKRSANLLV